MAIGPLRASDFDDFAYDFGRTYSIFFDQPFELSIPGVGREIVGKGLGGFSASLFHRGFSCIACGNCCYGDERVWIWLPGSIPPEDTLEVPVSINGHVIRVRAHVNQGDPRRDGCDYLQKGPNLISLDKVTPSKGFCSLWTAGVDLPDHCRQLPDMAVYYPHSRRGRVPLLSRRLPPRNWQTPKCPIPINTIPLDDATIGKDRAVWGRWVAGLKEVPGCRVEQAYQLWEGLIFTTQSQGKGPRENIYFSEWF